MAKHPKKRHKPDDDFAENLQWYLVIAYVLSCVGLLPNDKELKLAHLAEQASGRTGQALSWKEGVRELLGVDDAFVRKVFRLCAENRDPVAAVYFILRGFECPDPARRVMEILDIKA